MKKFLFLLLAVTTGTAAAQTLVYSGGQKKPAVPKTFDNELGVRESRERSVQNNYYNGSYADPYGAYSGGGADVGSTFLNVLLAILPSGFEVHAGFTPGLMCGPFTTEGYSTTDPSWRPYTVRQRFSCTFDAGARLIIPIWRFNLFGDFTYHCYLTDNFRAGEFRPSRSYMGLGVGLSFNF